MPQKFIKRNKHHKPTKPTPDAKLFIISGPSGVGKTAIVLGVLKKLPGLKTTVTYTTRKPRKGKAEDKVMKYVSKKTFSQKIKNNEFLEWAIVHGESYGTAKKETLIALKNCHLLCNVDVQGALNIKKKLPQKTVLIFIKPDTFENLSKRIKKRGAKMLPKELEQRLNNARKELNYAKFYDYQVINYENKLDKTINKVSKIIKNCIQSN